MRVRCDETNSQCSQDLQSDCNVDDRCGISGPSYSASFPSSSNSLVRFNAIPDSANPRNEVEQCIGHETELLGASEVASETCFMYCVELFTLFMLVKLFINATKLIY